MRRILEIPQPVVDLLTGMGYTCTTHADHGRVYTDDEGARIEFRNAPYIYQDSDGVSHCASITLIQSDGSRAKYSPILPVVLSARSNFINALRPTIDVEVVIKLRKLRALIS